MFLLCFSFDADFVARQIPLSTFSRFHNTIMAKLLGVFFKHEEKNKYVSICLCFRFFLFYLFIFCLFFVCCSYEKRKKNKKKKSRFLCFCEIHIIQNLRCHHRHCYTMEITLMLASFESKVLSR